MSAMAEFCISGAETAGSDTEHLVTNCHNMSEVVLISILT